MRHFLVSSPLLLTFLLLPPGCTGTGDREGMDAPAPRSPGEEDGCEFDGDCEPGERCIDGECFAEEDDEDPAAPGACGNDDDCPAGQVCSGGICRSQQVEPAEGEGEGEGEEGEGEEGEGGGEGEGEPEPPPPTACQPDAFEPNDVPAQATQLDDLFLDGVSLCSRDEDWYRIALQRGDNVVVDVLGPGLQVEIRAPDGLGIVGMSNPTARGAQAARAAIPATGGYVLRVWGRIVASYSLQLEIEEAPVDPVEPQDRPQPPQDDPPQDDPPQDDPWGGWGDWDDWGDGDVPGACADDRYEENDSQNRATLLRPGYEEGLMICAGDEDWYRVELAAGAWLEVGISFELFSDLDLYLYDARGSLLEESAGIFLPSEELSYTAAARGEVFVQVVGFLGAESSYELSLAVEGGQAPPPDDPLDPGGEVVPPPPARPVGCHDAFEPNGSSVEAALLPPGSYQLALCAGQEDWFTFRLPATGPVSVELIPDPGTGDLDLALGDADLYELGLSEEIAGEPELISLRRAPAGKIYILVYGYTEEDEGSYTLNLEY